MVGEATSKIVIARTKKAQKTQRVEQNEEETVTFHSMYYRRKKNC